MTRDLKIAPDLALRPPLDAQLRRYHRSYRRRLRKQAKASAALRDLLYSFPAAAFTLAAGNGNPLHRADAVRFVEQGASLREVGSTLGLPAWLRHLPPEAFAEPFGMLPSSDRFSRRVVNTIPRQTAECAMWLQWVDRANMLCDEDFALWIAKQRFWSGQRREPDAVFPLAAYAWFSRAHKTPARGLIERSWAANMNFAKALDATRNWFVRCLSEYCNDYPAHTGRWFVAQNAKGFRIVPLGTNEELIREGKRMRNCVAQYAGQVASGACLIYSVRCGTWHAATLEVRPHWEKPGEPLIAQLLGPDNTPVDAGLLEAVEGWLARQGRYPFTGAAQLARMPYNTDRWAALWAPFHAACNHQGPAIQPLQFHRALGALAHLA